MFAKRSSFPDLPPIAHVGLAKRVLTHSSASLLRGGSKALNLGLAQYPFPDNSKLEHIGDSIIGTHVILLLQEIAGGLQVGPATELKASLVNNKHLASLATAYGLDKSIVAAPSARHTVVSEPNSRAGVFEAYVAGVYYDFFVSETPGQYNDQGLALASCLENSLLPTQPRSPNTGSSSPQEIDLNSDGVSCGIGGDGNSSGQGDEVVIAPRFVPHPSDSLPELKPKTERTHGDAFAYVGGWLRPLFRAIAPSAHRALLKRKAEEVFMDEVDEDAAAVGATALLNEWVMQRTGGLPRYAFSGSGMRHQCTCTVSVASQTHTASAIRSKKKGAMSVAAWRVGLDLGLL